MPKKLRRKNNKRFALLSILGIISLLIIPIILVVIFYSGILNTVSITLDTHSIRNDLGKARQAAEPRFDSQQAALIHTLYTSGVINSPASTYSAKVDYCYFLDDKKDEFNTINWNQNCSLRYFDLLETSLSREEILQKLALNPNVSSNFGSPSPYNLGKGGKCDPIYQYTNFSTSLTFLDWSRGNNLLCQIYNPSTNNTTYFGPNVFKAMRSYDTGNVDRRSSYLYIAQDHNYFTKSLGCGSQGLFGCSMPIKEPITDF